MEQRQCYHIFSILVISEVPPCLPVSVILPKKFHKKKKTFSQTYIYQEAMKTRAQQSTTNYTDYVAGHTQEHRSATF